MDLTAFVLAFLVFVSNSIVSADCFSLQGARLTDLQCCFYVGCKEDRVLK
jgi:hypothetical protein